MRVLALFWRETLNDRTRMVLNVATQTPPPLAGTAERYQIMKIRVARRQLLKIIAIIDILFAAGAIDQPEIAPMRARRISKEPLRKSAHRRDPGAGADKD